VREAIIKELEHEYNMKWLVENGYIMPEGARRNEIHSLAANAPVDKM
jgi:hypothetical protein